MTKTHLTTLFLSLLAVHAAACGDPNVALDEDFDPPVVDDPIEPPILEELPEEERIALFDNDSADDPAVDEFLSITGTREIAFTDQISAEDGDNEDFVQFELPNASNPNQNIAISIDCDVYGDENVTARVDLFNVDGNDETRINGGPIDCNEGEFFVTVQNDQVQLAVIRLQGVPEVQTLVEYTLHVKPFR